MKLLLVDLPSESTEPILAHARPLGGRTAVTARIADILPGTKFDEQGHGSFRREGDVITFTD